MLHGSGSEPRVVFNLFTLIGTMFAVGLAIGVTISVGILFIIQLKGIIRNRTGIEDWIEQKVSAMKSLLFFKVTNVTVLSKLLL